MATGKQRPRRAAKTVNLSACPQCGYDAVWVDQTFVVEFTGKIVGGRMMAFCNTTTCDQRYWFYPMTGRITRRNTGRFSTYYHRPVVEEPEPEPDPDPDSPAEDCGDVAQPLTRRKRVIRWYEDHIWWPVVRFLCRIQGAQI